MINLWVITKFSNIMRNFRKIVTYRFHKDLTKYAFSYIHLKLTEIDGLKSFNILSDSVTIDYVSLELYEQAVKNVFHEIDYQIRTEQKKRPRITVNLDKVIIEKVNNSVEFR